MIDFRKHKRSLQQFFYRHVGQCPPVSFEEHSIGLGTLILRYDEDEGPKCRFMVGRFDPQSEAYRYVGGFAELQDALVGLVVERARRSAICDAFCVAFTVTGCGTVLEPTKE